MKLLFALITLLLSVTYSHGQKFQQFNIDSLKKVSPDWNKFLDNSSMFLGVYQLKKGTTDRQTPHNEDEVYYVIAGKSKFTVSGKTVSIVKGDILFVAAKANHQFKEIEEDLTLLVFFSKAK